MPTHRGIPFKCADDLPRWIYVDFRTRLTNLQALRPPVTHRLTGYVLGSKGFETIALVPARECDIETWKRRRAWIPRLADFDDEMYCARKLRDPLAIKKTGLHLIGGSQA